MSIVNLPVLLAMHGTSGTTNLGLFPWVGWLWLMVGADPKP